MGGERPDYIVVEGPIGVGKTSLATRLAKSFDSDLLLDVRLVRLVVLQLVGRRIQASRRLACLLTHSIISNIA